MVRLNPTGGTVGSSQPVIPELPPHETVTSSLTNNAFTSLQALSKSRQFQLLDQYHKTALELLTECTVDITDALYTRNNQQRKAKASKKKGAKGKKNTSASQRSRGTSAVNSDEEEHDTSTESEDEDEMDVDDEENRKKEEEFSHRVDLLTGSAELHVRKVIDGMQRRHDDDIVLKDLIKTAGEERTQFESGIRGTQPLSQRLTQRLRRGDVDDSQMSRLSSVTAPGETQNHDSQMQVLQLSQTFIEKSQESKDNYGLLSMRRKYANHNDYIYFRRQVWEAAHGVEEVPMPSRSTWFPDDGRGASPAPGIAEASGTLEDDEDDVQATRIKISTKCPLSLTEMQNPVSSKKCPHVFEKMAVEQFIRNYRSSQQQNRSRNGPIGNPVCPVVGCNERIGLVDLHVDLAVQRKIKRLQELKKRENEGDDEDIGASGFGRRGKSMTVGFEELDEDSFEDDI